MQEITMNPPIDAAPTIEQSAPTFAITWEAIAYIALAILALTLRLAELDRVPIFVSEAREALSAYRDVTPDAVGGAIAPSSPIVHLIQSASFVILGGSESAARVGTALAGAGIILIPLVLKRLIGRGRALALATLLALSPVLLASSRMSAPTVWAILFAVLAVRAAWRWRVARRPRDGVFAVTMAAGVIFLTDGGGLILALIVAGAALIAQLWHERARSGDDVPSVESITGVPRPPRNTIGVEVPAIPHAPFPWGAGLAVAAISVLAVATTFALNPSGLNTVGAAVGGAFAGFGATAPDTPPLAPVTISVFYEATFWFFAFAAWIGVGGRGELTLFDRFCLAWMVLALIASMVWRAGTPPNALWFTVPLAGLASEILARAFAADPREKTFRIPGWARYSVALGGAALLMIAAISLQSLAREILRNPDNAFSANSVGLEALILVFLATLFMIFGFLMAVSLWGTRTAWRGALLAGLGFGAIVALGSGWRIAVGEAGNPAELWHSHTTHADTVLLRQTLIQVAERESGGFLEYLPVTALAPSDGVIAWTLRDFREVQYIQALEDATADPVVLLPLQAEPPNLGGAYVGQDFLISQTWDVNTVELKDLPAWWLQNLVRVPYRTREYIALWLRQDIYEGVPLFDAANVAG